MVDFFDDSSHCAVDVSLTQIFGWLTLDKDRSDYKGSGANSQGRQDLVDWARQAAVKAGHNLDGFFGVVVCMNAETDLWGGGARVVCSPNSTRPSLLGQEMGHGYGLEHSRIDGSTADYTDKWDVMSTATTPYEAAHPEFGQIGPGLNAWNMRSQGWLEEPRVWRLAPGQTDGRFDVRPLYHRDLPGWLAAELPGGYLCEFRIKEEWDAGIPRPAVLIHRFEGGHSNLMKGASDVEDLTEGDSFERNVEANGSFQRVSLDVARIDGVARTATLRVRCQRIRWSQVDSGTLHTNDCVDSIEFTIEHGVVPADEVRFSLVLAGNVTWKKSVNMPDGEGNDWNIVSEGANAQSENGLWSHQVNNGQVLTFYKAKFLGAMTSVLTLGDLHNLRGGDRVTFRWAKD